jgi:inner membrane protein
MLESLTTLEPHWMWLIVAALLATAEIVAPGFFLIWLAAAAGITGIAAMFLPISMTIQIMLFAVLSVAAVYAGRHWFTSNPIISEDPKLNDRAARLIGEVVTVTDPIKNGVGRVKLGDGVWKAKGPDAIVGTAMRVTGIDGGAVTVETI